MAVIFLPGIKGSELVDSYPLNWPTRWSLEDMVVGNIVEDPMDFRLAEGRYEAADGHWMRPARLIQYAYGAMLDKLRAWKAPEPVYTFTYDWRKPLECSVRRLVQVMDEIAGRERAAGRDPELRFVTHSMGSLVLRAALPARNRREPFAGIGRIVFIAPPFRGSHGAPHALVVGEKDGWFGTDKDYRSIARSFPAVYQMTPSWKDAAVDEQGRPLDLFDPANWQANVRDGGEFQPRFLTDAEAFVRGRRAQYGGASEAPMLADSAMAHAADKVLVLCATGTDTLNTLPVQTDNRRNPNWFDYPAASINQLGDGRVSLQSAALKGVTLAAFHGIGAHAVLCRDERVTAQVSLWLDGNNALRMTPRGPQHSVGRPGRSYFRPWDGKPESFSEHIV